MMVPGGLCAGVLFQSGGHISLSIVTPLSGSNIPNNSTAEAITGVASSSGGNITALQYQIDGGAWNNFTFTPAASVSYSGGNAGQIGAGTHTITVKATDAAANVQTVTSTYTITASPPATSYTWTPADVYSGAYTHLNITSAVPFSAVAYTATQFDAHGSAVGTIPMTSLGTTDASGNFSFTGTAAWAPNAWTDNVQLFVGGTQVGTFTFSNFGVSPSYSYGPSTAPNGTALTLSIANSWASSVVSQTTTFSPSGNVAGPTVLGSTSSTGNFSYGGTAAWGSDTSCVTTVSLNGVPILSQTFVP